MKKFGRLNNQRGQTATEYILMISVLVLGLLAAASALLPTLNQGVGTMSETLNERFENNPATFCDPVNNGNC